MKTVFAKYSTERNPEFQIKTVIAKDENGKKQVIKYPYSPKAQEHITAMLSNSEKINEYYGEAGFSSAKAAAVDNGVAFEYIEGVSLEERLEEISENGTIQDVFGLINDLKNSLLDSANVKPFYITDEFKNVFGNESTAEELNAMDFTCFDLAFGNIILRNDKKYIIDYEWCFDFPVPIEYLVYRALNIYIVLNSKNELLDKDIYGYLGFDKAKRAVFDSWEDSFQKYAGKNAFKTRDVYEKFGSKNYSLYDLMSVYNSKNKENWSQVYLDYGKGFSENDSYRRMFEDNKSFELNIALTDDVKSCRFDPEDNSCIMTAESITAYSDEGMYKPEYISNGCESGGTIYFSSSDPQIVFQNLKKGTRAINIKCRVISMDARQIESLGKAVFDSYAKENRITEMLASTDALKREIAQNKHEISSLTAVSDDKQREIERLFGENDFKQQQIDSLNNMLEQAKADYEYHTNGLLGHIKNLEESSARQQEYISAIENSKAWKLVCKVRKILGR